VGHAFCVGVLSHISQTLRVGEEETDDGGRNDTHIAAAIASQRGSTMGSFEERKDAATGICAVYGAGGTHGCEASRSKLELSNVIKEKVHSGCLGPRI
jgi:hypothetical protein